MNTAFDFFSSSGSGPSAQLSRNPRPLSAQQKREIESAKREFMSPLDAAFTFGTPAASPAAARQAADLRQQERATRRFMRENGMA